jgi:hypothetical protein
LDAGNLFFTTSKSACDQEALGKADLILTSYRDMGYAAINLSQRDLSVGVPFLLKTAREMNVPLLSSNLAQIGTGEPLFKPFIIKRIGGLAVGIFGLMDQPKQVQKSSSYLIKNPYDTAREAIGSLKDKAGLIIVLSSLSKELNVKLLEEFSAIDFIISTDNKSRAPTRVKDAYILSSGDKGKYLGNLDISLNSSERPLGLKDIGRKRKLESTLSWTKRRIPQLKEKEETILKGDNPRVKERFKRELDRLTRDEARYREELAKLGNNPNYFENRIIPLAAKQSEESIRLSQKPKGNVGKSSRHTSPGPHIRISEVGNDKERKVTYVLLVDKSPNQVRAMGFDVTYDPKVLKYSGYTKGELIRNFDMFDAAELKDGLLRVGGFEARSDSILPGKSGELISFNFNIIGKGNSNLNLIRLKDDISAWVVE